MGKSNNRSEFSSVECENYRFYNAPKAKSKRSAVREKCCDNSPKCNCKNEVGFSEGS